MRYGTGIGNVTRMTRMTWKMISPVLLSFEYEVIGSLLMREKITCTTTTAGSGFSSALHAVYGTSVGARRALAEH